MKDKENQIINNLWAKIRNLLQEEADQLGLAFSQKDWNTCHKSLERQRVLLLVWKLLLEEQNELNGIHKNNGGNND